MKTVKALKYKKLNDQAILEKAHKSDAGYDLKACNINITPEYIEYGTGIAVEIPEGYVGFLCARSSISKYDLMLANGIGVIDSGYKGELKMRFKVTDDIEGKVYHIGDRCGQLVLQKLEDFLSLEVDEFSSVSDRGVGGFGSSGV